VAAYFPKVMLTEAEVFANVSELAARLESFDPAQLRHVRVFVPFVRCTCTVKCTYDAERFVQDAEAFRAAHKRLDERYAAWCERDEIWRSRNHFKEDYPNPDEFVKYEKDVRGAVSVSGNFGPYLAIARIPDVEGVSYVPWERMCKDVLAALSYSDYEEGESQVGLHALSTEKEVYDGHLGMDIQKAVEKAIRDDSRTDSKRVLRGLRISDYTYEIASSVATYIPLHIYRLDTGKTAEIVLADGCLGNTWTSFSAKPASPPPPLVLIDPHMEDDEGEDLVDPPPCPTPPKGSKPWQWVVSSLSVLVAIGIYQAYVSGRFAIAPSPPAQFVVQAFAAPRQYVVVPGPGGSPRVDMRAGPGRNFDLEVQLWVGDRLVGAGSASNGAGSWIAVTREDGASGFVAEQFLRQAMFDTSFDCARASLWAEQRICSTQSLAEADQRVAALYAAVLAMASGDDRSAVLESQRSWIEGRNNCRNSTSPLCLETSFRLRISELERWKAGLERGGDQNSQWNRWLYSPVSRTERGHGPIDR